MYWNLECTTNKLRGVIAFTKPRVDMLVMWCLLSTYQTYNRSKKILKWEGVDWEKWLTNDINHVMLKLMQEPILLQSVSWRIPCPHIFLRNVCSIPYILIYKHWTFLGHIQHALPINALLDLSFEMIKENEMIYQIKLKRTICRPARLRKRMSTAALCSSAPTGQSQWCQARVHPQTVSINACPQGTAGPAHWDSSTTQKSMHRCQKAPGAAHSTATLYKQ